MSQQYNKKYVKHIDSNILLYTDILYRLILIIDNTHYFYKTDQLSLPTLPDNDFRKSKSLDRISYTFFQK